MSTLHIQRDPTLRFSALAVRLALAVAFLSAVADRLGFWGPPGADGVAWGNVKNYESYVALLNWFVPAAFIPFVGWTATVAEVVIALGLIFGWQLRSFALAAGLLLTIFGLAMGAALGPKSPLDYSVFSAATAAFLLFKLTRLNENDMASTTDHPA